MLHISESLFADHVRSLEVCLLSSGHPLIRFSSSGISWSFVSNLSSVRSEMSSRFRLALPRSFLIPLNSLAEMFSQFSSIVKYCGFSPNFRPFWTDTRRILVFASIRKRLISSSFSWHINFFSTSQSMLSVHDLRIHYFAKDLQPVKLLGLYQSDRHVHCKPYKLLVLIIAF